MSRKQERENALMGIFQMEFHKDSDDFSETIANYYEEESLELKGYGKDLIDITSIHLEEIDAIIAGYLKKTWKMDRLPKVEKSVLRLAICELAFLEDKPPYEVVINEAVELTKKYGEENGKKYVNGILNAFVKGSIHEQVESGD